MSAMPTLQRLQVRFGQTITQTPSGMHLVIWLNRVQRWRVMGRVTGQRVTKLPVPLSLEPDITATTAPHALKR
jgi:hypothetical protein